MEYKQEVENRLRRLDGLRREVERLDEALSCLTPEERLVVQMMIVAPEKGAVGKLCQILQVEQSSIYRRRERAIRKLGEELFD